MQNYYCQQLTLFRQFKIFLSPKLLTVRFAFPHIRSKMSDPKESSSQEYRDKKYKESKYESTSSDSDSDKDDDAASSSDYTKPTSDKSKLDSIQQYFKLKFGISLDDDESDAHTQPILKTVDFQGLVDHWNEHGFRKIVVMSGAGISTSAGIPDFRSPNTGLYHNLQKYDLPYPTAVFEIGFFHKNPAPFFALAKELHPGNFRPTPSHYFIRLLHEKGLLLRHYTQNIDTLEHIAGIPSEKLVEAHGTFRTNHCVKCREEYSMEWVKEQIFADNVPTCTKCNGIVKPDIVFFGEDLPRKFYVLPQKDFKECDLLIIMGTSLEVQPFASLITKPNKRCVRLLINRELVGSVSKFDFFFGSSGLLVGKKNNKRDVAWLGDCDDGVQALADKIGFGDELKALIEREHKRILEDERSAAVQRIETTDDEANKKPNATDEAIQTKTTSTEDNNPKL